MSSNNHTFTSIPIQTLSTGREISLNVHTFKGPKKGLNVYIQASVHGSELQGNLVIKELIDTLKNTEISGKITLVPLANPRATENKVSTFTQGRFHPETGDNWNRLYSDVTDELNTEEIFNQSTDINELKTLYKKAICSKLKEKYLQDAAYGIRTEKLLHYELQSLASDADIILDLHTGPVACEYVYTRKDHSELARDLNFPFYLEITNEFAGAMDEASFMPWVQFEKECSKRNIKDDSPFEAYTLELGSEEFISSPLAKSQSDKITCFLQKRGLLKTGFKVKDDFKHANDLSSFKSYFSPQGGLIEFVKKPGEKVKKDECLYRVFNFDQVDISKKEVTAINDCYVINHMPSSAAAQGACIYQVLEI